MRVQCGRQKTQHGRFEVSSVVKQKRRAVPAFKDGAHGELGDQGLCVDRMVIKRRLESGELGDQARVMEMVTMCIDVMAISKRDNRAFQSRLADL